MPEKEYAADHNFDFLRLKREGRIELPPRLVFLLFLLGRAPFGSRALLGCALLRGRAADLPNGIDSRRASACAIVAANTNRFDNPVAQIGFDSRVYCQSRLD